MTDASREESLYQQVEDALHDYTNAVSILKRQQHNAAALLANAESVIVRGEDLYRKLLEQRRRVEKLFRENQRLHQSINRDCQGMRDSLELHKHHTADRLTETTAQTEAGIARVEQQLCKQNKIYNRRLLYVTLLASITLALLALLVITKLPGP